MRKIKGLTELILVAILALVFTTAQSPALKYTTIGEVTSIQYGTLIVKEEGTGQEYVVIASPEQLARVRQGYRVEVEISDGAAKLIDILGMEMQAEPFPDQYILVPPYEVEKIPEGEETPKRRVLKPEKPVEPRESIEPLGPTGPAEPIVPLEPIEPIGTPGALVRFDVSGEPLTVFITNPKTIQDVIDRTMGVSIKRIPMGRVIRGKFYDPRWSWHLDPESVTMNDITMELCNAKPSDVEDNLERWIQDVGFYCPWNAEIVDVKIIPKK